MCITILDFYLCFTIDPTPYYIMHINAGDCLLPDDVCGRVLCINRY